MAETPRQQPTEMINQLMQHLTEDRNRLATLLSAARQVGVARDAKLKALKEVLTRKCREPLNPGGTGRISRARRRAAHSTWAVPVRRAAA